MFAERGDFGAEHVGRDMLAVIGGLSNGIRDGVSLGGRELGVCQGQAMAWVQNRESSYHGPRAGRAAGSRDS